MATERHILISGYPGCGKTTLLVRLARRLGDLQPAGFYTEEIREGGVRQGFRLVGLDGREGLLAHVRHSSRQRVGRYGVDVAGFEAFLDGLRLADLVFVDEVGRMECLSPRFVALMRELLASGRVVVATVALRGSGFIAEVKRGEGDAVTILTPGNREALLPVLEARIRAALGGAQVVR